MRRLVLTWMLAIAAAGTTVTLGVGAQVPMPPPPSPMPARDAILAPRGRGPSEPQVRTVPVGSASITGAVTASDTGRPLKGVRVTVSGNVPGAPRMGAPAAGARVGAPVMVTGGSMSSLNGLMMSATSGFSRTAVTDAQGQFTFQRLPAGRFTITATRNSYLNASHGQKRPGGRGTPLALMDGQQTRVAMAMVKGGVITGAVIGDDGEPQPNAQVRLWRYASETGVRRLQNSNGTSTDDRGVYRFHGVQPGEYIVSATPNSSDLGIERVAAEMAAIEQAIASATPRPSTVPGVPPSVSVTMTPPQPGEQQAPMAYLPTYHPSSPVPTDSPVLRVAGGDERAGVDIQVQPIRASSIQGSIGGVVGPGIAVQVMLQNEDPTLISTNMSTRVNQDARFTFGNIPPGRYTLLAYTVPGPNPQFQATLSSSVPTPMAMPAQGPPRLDDSQKQWGRVSVNVEGQQPLVGVTLNLQPSRTISGQVVFDMTSLPDLTRMRFNATLGAAPNTQVPQTPQPAVIGPDGRFTISGVYPGKYILRASGGTLKSSIINGQDTLDVPLDFTGDRDITDAVLTVTDKSTELTGTLTDATGKPAFDYSVLAVSADQRFWTPGSRRIMTAQLGLDGTYTFRNLPPGDYMVAAISDLEPGAQYDQELLRSLASASMRVTLTEGQKLSQNLRVAK